MIIRTQNKQAIINFDKICAIMTGDKNNENQICAHVMADTNALLLGKYTTAEQALNVLDEIQKAYIPYSYTSNGVIVKTEENVYQMPPDEAEETK